MPLIDLPTRWKREILIAERFSMEVQEFAVRANMEKPTWNSKV